ncbi:MAG: class I SAM-dependent methyltransferase [Candidatus Aenigmarchaeota archaeon]|nr:class I SAM-dependent methyltransferase [Candidatus Aenigmarchaeota archaeon]
MGNWESIFKKSGKVFLKTQEDMKKLISLLKKEKSKKILDLGCGSGRHVILLAKHGFDVYATDVSKAGLKMTRKWLRDENISAKLKEHSCYEKFPFKDNYFDAVISTQVIHHNFHDKVKFCILEIERVLKSEGIVFVTVSGDKYRTRATKFDMPEPRTYIPLNGREKGLPHYFYTKKLMRRDFKNFKILSLHKDKGDHWCLLGRLKEIAH